MATTIVKRPVRQPAPELPAGEVVLEAPPEIPPPAGKGWSRALMIIPMGCMAGAGILMMVVFRLDRIAGPLMYVVGGLFAVGLVGMFVFMILNQQNQGPSKQEMATNRRRYLRKLSQLRAQVRETILAQRRAMCYRHPDPDKLWSTALSARLWERRPGDWDYGVVRIGVGPQELATRLVPPDTKPVDELEPLCALALRKFVTKYATVADLPVAVALRGFSRIYVTGEPERKRAFARALVAQLATFHAPGDVLTAFCVHPQQREVWEWAKWLPHAMHTDKVDGLGQLRLVAPSIAALEAMLDNVVGNRPRFDPAAAPIEGNAHVVVLLDGGDVAGSEHLLIEAGVEGVTVIDLGTPPPRLLNQTTLVLTIGADSALTSRTMDGEGTVGRVDALPLASIKGLARQLAPLRLSALSVGEQPLASSMELTDLLGMRDPYELDLAAYWTARSNRERLRVPIGLQPDGRPLEIDLKESAQDGMGPHGLLVGATGSGKSELLRTLVLGLAVTHSPEILNFVLVDFKGGATFTRLDQLPHTSAVITNLADELQLVDRMLDAIQGELMRRQELLRAAGNYASQRDYERARAAGAPLEPMPALLVIVDEFSELLTARPDFIDMFVQIGRVGRSLAVHLLLASQRLDEGKLRGLEPHLSYRVGLRTFSAMESRAVLGVPDAYQLPRSPGNGFLKTEADALARFRAAYVSGRHQRGGALRASDGDGRRVAPIQDYSTHYLVPQVVEEPAQPESEADDNQPVGETLLDVLVAQMEGKGKPAHQVWLPPLTEPPTLDQLLAPLAPVAGRGLTTGSLARHGALRAVVGVTDKPFEQRRDPLWLDLAEAGGNVAVVGGPRSGKSTVVRTLIGSLALSHTPQEVQFICLDFGGGGLTAFRDLAHVSGAATRRDRDRVRRGVGEAHTLLAEREQRFGTLGVDTMTTYRELLRSGRVPDDGFGDVFLVIDGWQTIRSEYEDLEPTVVDLINRGIGFGIHVVVTCSRWMDLRSNVRDMFGTRLELKLGDPIDSQVGRRQAAGVPEQAPGRGLTPDGFHFLAGVPRIDGKSTDDRIADGVTHLVTSVNDAWQGARAPAVRMLPAELPFSALPPPDRRRGVPIGIAERNLQPVHLDFQADPHLLLFADVQCGKSSFLRVVASGLMNMYSPQEAQLLVVDYRRSLLGVVPEEYQVGYAANSGALKSMIGLTVDAMTKRLPGADVTPEQLRNRSWWTGPELFLLIDDYDLVATSPHANPLSSLLDFLTQGRDIGFHMVVVRRSGGAGRSLFDPVLSRLRDLASPGIMMSGSREEGPLLGGLRAEQLPPGRGRLISRAGGPQLIQLAHLPPAM